jgi:CRISP-associated protein Cas1
MHQLLNSLYVMTPRSYVHLDHETLKVKLEGELKLQVPLHHLGAVFCIGDVQTSTALLHRRFKARLEGPASGNVLLRRAQHEALSSASQTLAIARCLVAGKIQNARQVLLRGGRETAQPDEADALQRAALHLAELLPRLVTDAQTLDHVRGLEGDAARTYFAVFDRLIK